MNRTLLIATLAASLVATRLTLGQGRSADAPGHNKDDDSSEGVEQVPDSSVDRVEDHGHRAHTNHVVFLRGKTPPPPPAPTEPAGFSPATIRSAYNLPSTGGIGTIAIVDAYDYPTALADFNTFSNKFGLFPEGSTDRLAATNQHFQVVYAAGATHKPSTNCGWNQEEALDIEWAHAMAPSAKIVLVEAASTSFADLFQAIGVANSQPNVAEVSMSWGGNEFSSETGYDGYFNNNLGVVYFAASGDTAGDVIYPSSSQYVVSAGGTTLVMNSNGTYKSETGWGSSKRGTSGSGGGPSRYELPSTGQANALHNSVRWTPDLSFDADPATGVAVYDSTTCQGSVNWQVFGGTSVASPSLAGISNLGSHLTSPMAEFVAMYGGYPTYFPTNPGGNFRDVVGSGGEQVRYTVTSNWDFVTGIGSAFGIIDK